MAFQTRREAIAVREWLTLPIEWLQGAILRVFDRLNQERWTGLLTILGAASANFVVLTLLLQDENVRAIAFGILIFLGLFALRYPEVSVTIFITVSSGLFVNTLWYAGGGGGTGQRTLLILFLCIVFAQALFEHIRTKKEERVRLWTPLTVLLVLFWVYHMFHVLYIYLFLYNTPRADDVFHYIGIDKTGLLRYFDGHMIWIGILPIMILLRRWQRARRVIIILAFIMFVNVFAIILEYFSPLPPLFKVMFQLRAAGETIEGYRIRDPSGLYFSMTLFYGMLYLLGYIARLRWSLIAVFYAVAFVMVLLITKNRILWAGTLAFLPLVLLWKPPTVLLRQLTILGTTMLIFAALMLHPGIYTSASQIAYEAIERWSRNYAYGGDPRLDPSYQFREREREAWEHTYARLSDFQRVFGAGLEASYGFYQKSSSTGEYAHLPYTIYFERVGMHFAWYGRLLRYGWVGTTLLAIVFLAFFARAIYHFLIYPIPVYRAIIAGLVGSTIGVLSFDSLHMNLGDYAALAVVLMWAFVEAIPYWNSEDASRLDSVADESGVATELQ